MRVALLLKARGTAIELIASGSPPDIKRQFKLSKPLLGEELQYWTSSRGRCVRKRGGSVDIVSVALEPELDHTAEAETEAERILVEPEQETKQKRRYRK